MRGTSHAMRRRWSPLQPAASSSSTCLVGWWVWALLGALAGEGCAQTRPGPWPGRPLPSGDPMFARRLPCNPLLRRVARPTQLPGAPPRHHRQQSAAPERACRAPQTRGHPRLAACRGRSSSPGGGGTAARGGWRCARRASPGWRVGPVALGGGRRGPGSPSLARGQAWQPPTGSFRQSRRAGCGTPLRARGTRPRHGACSRGGTTPQTRPPAA